MLLSTPKTRCALTSTQEEKQSNGRLLVEANKKIDDLGAKLLRTTREKGEYKVELDALLHANQRYCLCSRSASVD